MNGLYAVKALCTICQASPYAAFSWGSLFTFCLRAFSASAFFCMIAGSCRPPIKPMYALREFLMPKS